MEVCERVGMRVLSRSSVYSAMLCCVNWVGSVLKCLLKVNYVSYFCFSDCFALTTTVPFHILSAYSELPILLASTYLPFVINRKCTGSLYMPIGRVVELVHYT